MRGIDLSGTEVEDAPKAPGGHVPHNPTGIVEIDAYDRLPARAREPIREAPFPVRAQELLPYVERGMVTPFNIGRIMDKYFAKSRELFEARRNGLA